MLRTLFQTSTRTLLSQQRCALRLQTVAGIYSGLKDVQHPEKSLTMSEVKYEIMKHLGLELAYRPLPKTREHLLQHQPKMEDLPPRSMQDSFTSAVLPLSSDRRLQDLYVSFLGQVRMGRLMEDMDLFAVWVCHQHLQVPNLPADVPLPYTFVTILVDKVTFSDVPTNINEDIRLSGHVSWVGRSSIEVVVWLEQKEHGKYKKITRALFLMAARNATNTGPAPVNPISPANDEEKRILAGGEDRKKRRHLIQTQSVLKLEPNDYEQSLMYQLYKRTTHTDTMELNKRMLPANCRWMSDWKLSSTIPSFPENRNAHNTVFGGFLMRQALENSWVSAYKYLGTRPKLTHISDISFEKPVPVSSFVKLTTYPVYTQLNWLQMITVADVVDMSSGGQATSNAFYSTYAAPDVIPEILPRSYHETMWYIHGRRKLMSALELEQQ